MRQTYATKTRQSNATERARERATAELDRQTDRTLADAHSATQRARKVLAEATAFLAGSV